MILCQYEGGAWSYLFFTSKHIWIRQGFETVIFDGALCPSMSQTFLWSMCVYFCSITVTAACSMRPSLSLLSPCGFVHRNIRRQQYAQSDRNLAELYCLFTIIIINNRCVVLCWRFSLPLFLTFGLICTYLTYYLYAAGCSIPIYQNLPLESVVGVLLTPASS